jgi:energy-coupling factor transporter ATP-binding protein EcfA2
MWFLDCIEINGGFLAGLKLKLPRGLTCIIGPRGTGKSTLAEAIRFAIVGTGGASKARLELIQANLGTGTLVTLGAVAEGGTRYTIRRTHRQPATLISADGKPIDSVDLDRGTFLPLDAYSSSEIEGIADETLGEKRRALLDALKGDELSRIHLSLGEHKRSLDANSDQIRALRRTLADTIEQIEELAGARSRLAALGPPPDNQPSNELVKASRQQQINEREKQNLASAASSLATLEKDITLLIKRIQSTSFSFADSNSSNHDLLLRLQSELATALASVGTHLQSGRDELARASRTVVSAQDQVSKSHAAQAEEYTRTAKVNAAASDLVRQRAELEESIVRVEHLESERHRTEGAISALLAERKTLKATFHLEREQISDLRTSVAADLQHETTDKVRIRVIRNADDLTYQQTLFEALRGARVRNHEEILASLMRVRPEQLAQLIQSNDVDSFEKLMTFGQERSRRILDAFRENIDPLSLEVTTIEDQIRIELNVSTGGQPNFKDASDLSRGQKCTALLPILLARRDNPLVIDQPEDNLDNHFIYETIVNSIRRLKTRRQMIFVTHNANIPVLAEAELVIVLNSDGKLGFVEKEGSVDDCRDEVIDLLEGGREAFELRRQRYGRA